MAVKYDSSYSSTGTDSTDPLYPGGKGVDSTSLSAKDGFPYKANVINDAFGFLQSLIRKGSRGRITTKAQYDAEVSGSPDDSVDSDYGNGLQAILDPIDPSVSEYDSTDNYVFGDLVQLYGSQYLCISANGAASTVSNPVADVYADYWYEIPSEKWLRGKAQVTLPFLVGIKPVFDYNDGSYEMVFPMGVFQKGNQQIEYFMVLHDDSNVISAGDDAYNAMANGTKGATIAALSAGDYTMIDGKDGFVRANGPNTLSTFGRQAHASQKTEGDISKIGVEGLGAPIDNEVDDPSLSGVFSQGDTVGSARVLQVSSGAFTGYALNFTNAGQTGQTYNTSGDGDGNEGSDPGENRPTNLIGGPLAQIVAATTAI